MCDQRPPALLCICMCEGKVKAKSCYRAKFFKGTGSSFNAVLYSVLILSTTNADMDFKRYYLNPASPFNI